MTGKIKPLAFFCEKRHECKWQGFALHQGLGWGEIPPENNEWRKWHDRECGGKLKQIYGQVETKAEKEHEFQGDEADCEECGEGRLHYIHQD